MKRLILLDPSEQCMKKRRDRSPLAALFGFLPLLGVAAIFAAQISGCTGATDVSTQPSQSEIEEAKQRRLAEIDKMTGLSEQERERMKAQVSGGGNDQSQARTDGLEKK